MGDWPAPAGSSKLYAEAAFATTTLTPFTPGAANVKGGYTELEASTPATYDGFFFVWRSATATVQALIDIAIGAAGSEQVIVSNLLAAGATNAYCWAFIPLTIKAGTRVSVRGQTTSGANSPVVGYIAGVRAGLQPSSFGRCTTYGAVTADSGGTAIDPGGSANTKGAWTELVASTTAPIRALNFTPQLSDNNQTPTAGSWLIDLGIGAAASEQIVVPDIYARATTGGNGLHPMTLGPLALDIPVGSRLAVRAQSTVTDATDRLIDVVVHAFD